MRRSFLTLEGGKKATKKTYEDFFFSLCCSAWPWTLSFVARLEKGTSKNIILLLWITLAMFSSKALSYIDETNYRLFQLKTKVTLWKISTPVITRENICSYGFNRQLYVSCIRTSILTSCPTYSLMIPTIYRTLIFLCYPKQVCLHKHPQFQFRIFTIFSK